MPRQIIHIPITHDPVSEMGWNFLKEELQSNRFYKEYNSAWRRITDRLSGEDINKIYQDTCLSSYLHPVISPPSPNAKAIKQLKKRGGKLMKTESALLMFSELALDSFPGDRIPHQKRDNYVAYRINRTLRPGETGVLFMGNQHRVHRILPTMSDISITTYDPDFQTSTNLLESAINTIQP